MSLFYINKRFPGTSSHRSDSLALNTSGDIQVFAWWKIPLLSDFGCAITKILYYIDSIALAYKLTVCLGRLKSEIVNGFEALLPFLFLSSNDQVSTILMHGIFAGSCIFNQLFANYLNHVKSYETFTLNWIFQVHKSINYFEIYDQI